MGEIDSIDIQKQWNIPSSGQERLVCTWIILTGRNALSILSPVDGSILQRLGELHAFVASRSRALTFLKERECHGGPLRLKSG